MRVMVLVKASAESEQGTVPSKDELAEMNVFNDELVKAGVMLDGAGLKASKYGARVEFAGKDRSVTDGPFTETKELLAGFWMWEVRDLGEAVEWAKRAPFRDDHLEIRPVFEEEDFEGAR